MAKSTPIRNNFNAGELSPKIDWRGDVAKYHSGAKLIQGFIPLVEGGVQRMPGTYFVKEVKDSSKATKVGVFQFDTDQGYVLEFGDQYIRIYKDKSQITDGGDPVELVTPYLEADLFNLKIHVQSSTVLYVFHPNYKPRKFSRSSDTEWQTTEMRFDPPPTRELGHTPDTTLTLDALTGSGITFTAGANVFIAGDVGRVITSGLGRATIVGYTSGTVVNCDIVDDFSGTPVASGGWTINLTPFPGIHSSTTTKGDITTLTGTDSVGTGGSRLLVVSIYGSNLAWSLSSGGTAEYYPDEFTLAQHLPEPTDVYINGTKLIKGTLGSLNAGEWDFGDTDTIGQSTVYIRTSDDVDPATNTSVSQFNTVVTEIFRSDDVDNFVYMGDGVLQILSVIDSSTATAVILQTLNRQDDLRWTLEQAIWSDSLGWPAVGFFFEQRLVMGGSTSFPNTFNASVSGRDDNFFKDDNDDSAAIEYSLVSDQVERINWISGEDFLLIGTFSGVWKVGATTSGDPITATNITAKKQAGIGTKNIRAIDTSDSTIWTDYSGLVVSRLDFKFEVDKYVATNMTRLAGHIMKGVSQVLSGVVEMAFQQAPLPIVWVVRADGQLIGMTYETQEDIYAWFRVVTDGSFESVIVLKTNDDEDQIWVVVRRVINGETVRYIEYFNPMELFSQIEDSFFVHSGVTFDGGDAMTITGITQANPAVVTATNTLVGGEKIRIADVEGMDKANTGRTKAWTVANPTPDGFELSGITSVGWDAYTGGGNATVVQKDFTSGLDHLLNETLDIVVDGAALPQKQFTGYPFSLSYYGNKVHVGMPAPAILSPTQPYLDTQQGVSRGNKQRISSVLVSFYETYGAKVGKDLDNLKPMKFGTGAQPELFTGEVKQPFDGDWGNEADLFIVQDKPLPMTVRAIKYGLSHNEDD